MTVVKKAKAMFPNAEGTEYEQYNFYTESDVVTLSSQGSFPSDVNNVQKALNFLDRRNTPVETTMTLNASGWSGASAPFVYNLSVPAQTGERTFLIGLTITNDQLKQLQLANIVDGGNGNNTVIFKAYGQKPTTNIPIRCIFIEKDKNINNINFGGGTVKAVPLADKSTAGQFDYTAANPTASNRLNYNGQFYATKIYGAVYNDYAEYRDSISSFEAGRVVSINQDGLFELSKDRLQPVSRVVTNTFGMSIGKDFNNIQNPIAVAGRALVYIDCPISKELIGKPICSGKDGKASVMTREEVIQYPDRMIGVVSSIPKKRYWGTDNIDTKDKVWIEVK